jgi:hypothetical protein
VLIVDDRSGHIDPAQECFEVVRLNELDIPDPSSLCFKYDLKELCTAVKAHLLDYLMRQKRIDRLLYLDPDILVTQPLDHLFEKLETSDIVLTPHLDQDYPDDDLLPAMVISCARDNSTWSSASTQAIISSIPELVEAKLLKHCVVDVLVATCRSKFIDLLRFF